MVFLRRTPLVRTTIDLYEGSRVAVALLPAPGRWPEREGSDRFVIPLGIAAMALARAEQAVLDRLRARLRATAAALADPHLSAVAADDWHERVSGLRLVESDGPGSPRIVAQLVKSALGPVPTVGRAAPGALALGAAAAAGLAVCLEGASADTRLAAALALEGLLGWYHEAHPHLQPPQQALAYSLRHADSPLIESGRVLRRPHERRRGAPQARADGRRRLMPQPTAASVVAGASSTRGRRGTMRSEECALPRCRRPRATASRKSGHRPA